MKNKDTKTRLLLRNINVLIAEFNVSYNNNKNVAPSRQCRRHRGTTKRTVVSRA